MIITFPHMGHLSIVLKTLINGLGREVIEPPPISKRTLDLGERYSPETACLPFKITLGNFIEAIEQGADTILTCGGVGPCRLGYYAEVQRKILERLGYRFKLLAIEPNIPDVYNSICHVSATKDVRRIYWAFVFAAQKMAALDVITREANKIRPREVNQGSADKALACGIEGIKAADTALGVHNARKECLENLRAIALKQGYRPLKVGLVGEIYVMLEPFVNFNLVRQLGKMGVEVYQTMCLTDYVRGHLLRRKEYRRMFKYIADVAKPYMGHYVGGHGLKSIGYTVELAKCGYDGMVHVYPFTCMPEVIAKNILPKVSGDCDIPVLSLAFDEQTGEAGILTRLEAFIDLLYYRRKNDKEGAEGTAV